MTKESPSEAEMLELLQRIISEMEPLGEDQRARVLETVMAFFGLSAQQQRRGY